MAARPGLILAAPSAIACLSLMLGCAELDASPEPMGEPIELGEACADTPMATGLGPGDTVPNLVGVDQYGQTLDLYGSLCDRHVLIIRAGFD